VFSYPLSLHLVSGDIFSLSSSSSKRARVK